MGRWLKPSPKHPLTAMIPMPIYERCIEGMQRIGVSTMTEFVIKALNEYLIRIGVTDTYPAQEQTQPQPKVEQQPMIRLALDDDSPLTSQIPVKDIVKQVQERDYGNVTQDILEGLGYRKKEEDE